MKRYGLGILSLLLVACGGGRTGSEHEAAAAAAAETDHELHLEPDQVAEWGITAGPVMTTDIVSTVTLPGSIELNEDRTARVSALIGGQVHRVAVAPGDRVRPGQTLLELASPEFARAQATWLEALARFRLSRTEAERARILFEERAIEERELLRRESEAEQAAAALGSAEAILLACGVEPAGIRALEERYDEFRRTGDGSGTVADAILPVIAPLGGRVIDRNAVRGEQVGPDRVLFTISDLGTLWAELDAYEQDLPFITPRSQVSIRADLYPGIEFPARILWISDEVDETLRTVTVRVEVENPDRLLRPNLFISGQVVNREPGSRRLMIPERAIIDLHGEKSVWVQVGDHDHDAAEPVGESAGEPAAAEEEHDHVVFAVRHVRLGELVGDMRIIASGLDDHDHVVVEGAFTLKAELEKGSAGHGHVH